MPSAFDDVVAVLRGVESFAGLREPALGQLASVATSVNVRAGDLVYRRGEAAQSLAVIRTGRLEVLIGAHDEAVATELTAGAVLGELGLLSGGTRSATVRAVRDSELIEIGATAFHSLLRAQPDVAMSLAETLAVRLRSSRDRSPPIPRISVIAVVATAPEPDWFAIIDGLIGELGQRSQIERIEPMSSTGPDGAATTNPAQRLHTAERAGGLSVLLVRDPSADPDWTQFCLRSSDRVVLLTTGGVASPWIKGDQLRTCDVAFVGNVLGGRVATCLATWRPRAHHFVPDATSVDHIGRLARRVTGQSIGLILSGGGARGLAHVGALAALEAADLMPDRVGGTSIGALVGALAAKGWSSAHIRDALEHELVHQRPFNDFTVPRRSVIRGHKAMAMLQRLLGPGSVEQLDLPYFAVSADLSTGERVVHRRGNLCDAVAASMAVPGLAPPVLVDGRLLVDGGVVDNLPVDVMAGDTEGPVLAIDVMRHSQHHGGRSMRRGGPLRRSPSIVETLVRASLLGSWEKAGSNRSRADLVVTPDVQDIGLLSFDRMDEAVAAGNRAMSDALLGFPRNRGGFLLADGASHWPAP